MKTVLITVLTLALLAPAAGALETQISEPTLKEYIIGFYDGPSLRPGDSYMGDRVVAVDLDLHFAVVETLNPDALAAKANLDSNVRYVEYNDPMYGSVSFTPNDALWNNQYNWGPKKIGAESAWDRTLGSTAVKVSVVDSGVLAAHEDLQGSRFLAGYDYYRNDATPEDNCGHGTHTLSTIAASTNNAKGFAGYAQVTIASHKALDKAFGGCYGSTTALVNALKVSRDGGFHLSSNSWGSTASSSALNDAVNYAAAGGVTIVAAAGNEGPCTNCIGYPWRDTASNVIIVGATDSNDAKASFSNNGAQLDVVAPGVSVGAAYINVKGWGCTNTCYAQLSGTSMATPTTTGVLALIKTLHPTYTTAQLDSQIKSTAVDLGAAGFDNDFGFGRINAAAAVV